jgi:uracil-DNA glycosylase
VFSLLLPTQVHKSFLPFIDQNRSLLEKIENELPSAFCPSPPFVLRFLTQDITATRVIILGQDPYPDPRAATGRCFEVGYLSSWFEPFRQVSLKNLVRALYHCYTGSDPYTPYRTILEQIKSKQFHLPSPNRIFSHWEEQGVLLLNTTFTCTPGQPGSHSDLWKSFTRTLLLYISEINPTISWFLWGTTAQSFSPFIMSGVKYPSRHPMMCSCKYEDDFLKNSCFIQTKEIISWI